MATGVAPGLQSRCGASRRPGWVRFPHVPAIWRAAAVIIALGATASPLAGQEADSAAVVAPVAEPAPDAARVAADSVPPVSPLGALARSLVLPGWGQTAVDRPLRGAIYFTLEAASLFMVFHSQSELSAAHRAEPPDEALIEARRERREDWIVLAVFWAFASGLDAWVSAHFWGFEAEVEPPETATAGVVLKLRLPVGSP